MTASRLRFGYDSLGESHRLLTTQNPRGVRDLVVWAAGGVVAQARVARDLANSVYDTLRLTVAETRGLAGTAAVVLDRASTVIDGFRTDVADTTAYLVNRWGAPTRVRNALGDESQLTRTNATLPALVTAVRAPNGRALVATYDTRGNLATLLDSATVKAGPVYALTQTTWDQRFDVPTRVINPEGDSTKSGYDATNGNLLWREDGRGSATRTTFAYDGTTGLLRRSLTAMAVKDTLLYETALLNAYRRDNVPGQYEQWTQDDVGRILRTERPVGGGAVRVDSLVLDAMDRPTQTTTRSPTDTLIVRQTYTAAGQLARLVKQSALDSLVRRAKVGEIPSAFVYDGRGRVTAESLPGFYTLSYSYDPAGNLLSGGRNPAFVTYDALNRPMVRIGSDTSTLVYDESGNLRVAFNAVARVARSYGQNGTLRTDSLRIATRRLNERVFTANVFGIGARYDLNLRRVAFQHPQTVAPAVDSQRVVFNGASGLVDTVIDVLGNRFRFTYDNDARPTSVVRVAQSANAMVESLSYDTVGRLRARVQRAGAEVLHRDTMTYDLKDRIIGVAGPNDGAVYNPLGPLDSVYYGAGGYEGYKTDALGLRYYGNGNAALNGTATYTYVPATERLDKLAIRSQTPATVSGDTTAYSWNLNGTAIGETRRKWFFLNCTLCVPPFTYREQRTTTNAYDLSWRLISSAFTLETLPTPGPLYKRYDRIERYRYDPLGRRVWKEMIRDTLQNVCQNHDASSGCRNEVTRTVWDGANILYDVRRQADTVGEASEGYPGASAFYGSVGYTHAGGVDAPLSLFKTGGFTVVPYHDWRGTYDVGTCPTTRCDDNVVYFPQKFALSFGDGPVLPTGPPNWYGEIIGGQADGSGYQYKRNRYYDPRSGRFTQEDPIGLAGGLNSYGFAGGNPISFSDPFGLCHTYEDKSKDANCVKLVADLRRAGAEAAKSLKAGERNVFEEAAAAFEATDREVKYVARDDGDLNRGGENTDKDPSTNALGRTMAHSIKIGNFLGVGDRLATAAHEIVVHGAEKNGLIFIGDALPTTPQTNQLIWSQLTPAAKQTAKLFMLMPGVSP